MLLPDTLGIRLVGYHAVDGGYIDNLRTKARNINRVVTSGLRGTLTWKVGDGWRAELGGGTQSIVSRDAQYVLSEDVLASRSAIAQPSWSDMRFGRLLLSKSWASGLQFVSATGIVGGSSFERFDASPVVPHETYQLNGDKTLFSHESRVSRRLAGGGSWVVGVNLVSDQSVMGRSLTIRQGVRPVIGVTNVTRSGAVFGEATHPVTGRLSLTLGGRVTAARVDGEPSITPRSKNFVRGRSTTRVDPTLVSPGRWVVTGPRSAGINRAFAPVVWRSRRASGGSRTSSPTRSRWSRRGCAMSGAGRRGCRRRSACPMPVGRRSRPTCSTAPGSR
ncbi:hypothetical protein GCM10020258_48720 [Sphingomonas yabuuchiae]